MRRTPLWRRALPEPSSGRANVRVHVKHGYGADVLEEVVELREISRDAAREIVARARKESSRIVHILRAGVSFCRMPGVPSEWPEGHSWVPLEGRKDATCLVCIDVANTVDKRT